MQPNCFIKTISERCRVCYTCVRECPAKAIRISRGQAEIVPERCIGCGNCVRICSQNAKQVASSIEQVDNLLSSRFKVSACSAPSFPAEFSDCDYQQLVGMLREMGFDYVHEVAFGADLVAREYKKLLEANKNEDKHYISTACPAIISYVKKYHPKLVKNLAPIVSPMVAMARVIHRIYGNDVKVVFIGPCIAKKSEAVSVSVSGEVDAVLTFQNFGKRFRKKKYSLAAVKPSDFDPPHAGLGSLFPVSRGLLQAAGITEDILSGEVVAADGRTNFVSAIKEFGIDALDTRLLELLACTGCIMGAGITTSSPLLARRFQVSSYARRQTKQRSSKKWEEAIDRLADLDMCCRFSPDDQRLAVPFEEEISEILAKMGKYKPEDELNCGACGYDTCREHAEAIFKGLAETEMCLPHTIEQLRMTVDKLATSDEQLADTKEALAQSEKLASMGQLAAGIAHEVNNPLGVALMYSHLLLDQFGDQPQLGEDLKMIVEQTDRCKKIVSQLLNFARRNKVQLKNIDICNLIDVLLKVIPGPENIEVRQKRSIDNPMVEVDPDQIVQVMTNLINNAYSAMGDGGILTIGISRDNQQFSIEVSDNGSGIPKENRSKIFEPFFTTKIIGKGTGLGLAVAYGIVKMHNGDIKVESNNDPAVGPTGTKFTVILPVNRQHKQTFFTEKES